MAGTVNPRAAIAMAADAIMALSAAAGNELPPTVKIVSKSDGLAVVSTPSAGNISLLTCKDPSGNFPVNLTANYIFRVLDLGGGNIVPAATALYTEIIAPLDIAKITGKGREAHANAIPALIADRMRTTINKHTPKLQQAKEALKKKTDTTISEEERAELIDIVDEYMNFVSAVRNAGVQSDMIGTYYKDKAPKTTLPSAITAEQYSFLTSVVIEHFKNTLPIAIKTDNLYHDLKYIRRDETTVVAAPVGGSGSTGGTGSAAPSLGSVVGGSTSGLLTAGGVVSSIGSGVSGGTGGVNRTAAARRTAGPAALPAAIELRPRGAASPGASVAESGRSRASTGNGWSNLNINANSLGGSAPASPVASVVNAGGAAAGENRVLGEGLAAGLRSRAGGKYKAEGGARRATRRRRQARRKTRRYQ